MLGRYSSARAREQVKVDVANEGNVESVSPSVGIATALGNVEA